MDVDQFYDAFLQEVPSGCFYEMPEAQNDNLELLIADYEPVQKLNIHNIRTFMNHSSNIHSFGIHQEERVNCLTAKFIFPNAHKELVF